jgi:hypothetical protein
MTLAKVAVVVGVGPGVGLSVAKKYTFDLISFYLPFFLDPTLSLFDLILMQFFCVGFQMKVTRSQWSPEAKRS